MTNIFLTISILITCSISLAQDFDLNNQWYTIGPIEEPSPESKASSKGIGPVEFIRTTKLQEGLLLAGSLNGGLFYTTNGGDSWLNAGSDYWRYSTATWAEFFPEDQNVWFASSHERESNGKPGRLGLYGGIYRTNDTGSSWELIADKNSFNGKESIAIYKFNFHPEDSKKMFVLTSDGVYMTLDCTAKKVEWKQQRGLNGSFYDICYVNDDVFFTGQQFGKWHIIQTSVEPIQNIKMIDDINTSILRITLQKFENDLLILVDFKSGADKLFLYKIDGENLIELSRSQRVTFGAGRTFAVNPYANNEIYIGVSTRLRRWNIHTKKFENLGSDYHVDVEYVEFDPFDSNKIYLATHGGVFISKNKGKSWDNKSYGIGISEVLGMDVGVSDPYQVVIGTFHDGSMVYANWDKDGKYYWKNVNGGDALIPLINPQNASEVYTSNQYTGGGLYYSSDTSKTIKNIHSRNNIKTSGWQMAAALHLGKPNYLFYNYIKSKGDSKGNIDIVRNDSAGKSKNIEFISNFKKSHNLKSYKVYGLYTTKYHPDILLAYVLHYDIDENGKPITKHRLFRTFNSLDTANNVMASWHELDMPRNGWLGDVVVDRKNKNKMYFSYVGGIDINAEYPNETGMVYYAKYKKRNNAIKRNFDISQNIPSDIGGKYNLVYTHESGKYVFIGTRNGVYMGTKFTLKGSVSWKKIGYGLPNCMVYGLNYNEEEQLLTVGLKGRGVWRISLASNETVLVDK